MKHRKDQKAREKIRHKHYNRLSYRIPGRRAFSNLIYYDEKEKIWKVKDEQSGRKR